MEFGADRIMVKDKLVKKLKIETIPEVFEILERHADTVFCAWFSNDMIGWTLFTRQTVILRDIKIGQCIFHGEICMKAAGNI
jgi:hypothetical protein